MQSRGLCSVQSACYTSVIVDDDNDDDGEDDSGDGDDAILAAKIWGSGTGFQFLEQKQPDRI